MLKDYPLIFLAGAFLAGAFLAAALGAGAVAVAVAVAAAPAVAVAVAGAAAGAAGVAAGCANATEEMANRAARVSAVFIKMSLKIYRVIYHTTTVVSRKGGLKPPAFSLRSLRNRNVLPYKYNMSVFYTYLLCWSSHRCYYYGVRYANNAHPSDLFKTYFTSSKHVKAFICNNGLPDIIQVRKTFTSKGSARNWENRVLRRMKVVNNSKWLNRTDNKAFEWEIPPRKGIILSKEIKSKISNSKKGKVAKRLHYTENHRKKASNFVLQQNFNKINSGTIWINNGTKNKRINPEQLESYPGFINGRLI